MPRRTRNPMSRREGSVCPKAAAARSITAPARQNRAVKKSSGGESASAIFATENAELHSVQKMAMRKASLYGASLLTKPLAADFIDAFPCCSRSIQGSVGIWKLNDRLSLSGNVNTSHA